MIIMTGEDLEQVFARTPPKERYDDKEEVLWKASSGKIVPAQVLCSFLNGSLGWTYQLQLRAAPEGYVHVGNIFHDSLRPMLKVASPR